MSNTDTDNGLAFFFSLGLQGYYVHGPYGSSPVRPLGKAPTILLVPVCHWEQVCRRKCVCVCEKQQDNKRNAYSLATNEDKE